MGKTGNNLQGRKTCWSFQRWTKLKWMDQNKLEQTAAILSPPTPIKTTGDIPIVKTPEGVQRNIAEY